MSVCFARSSHAPYLWLNISGDSYMAVTNLVKNQPNDHCKRIADFAVDAVAAANAVLIDPDDPSQGHVRIRVGL